MNERRWLRIRRRRSYIQATSRLEFLASERRSLYPLARAFTSARKQGEFAEWPAILCRFLENVRRRRRRRAGVERVYF